MLREEEIHTLMDLGLTLLQVKCYLALATLGKASIKSVAKTANIAQQDVYRLMPVLQKRGLAEKMLTAPVTYKGTPIKDGVMILLQRRAEDYAELQRKTEMLLNSPHENEIVTKFSDEESQFVVTSEKTLLYRKLEKDDRSAQKSIDIIGTWDGIKAALFYHLQWEFKKLMKRGIRIRIITEQHEDDKSMLKILRALKKNTLFGIRYVVSPVLLKTVIYDEKEVNMCIATLPDRDVPSLWSNNPNFVKIMTSHFEEIWNIAREDELENATLISDKRIVSS